MLWILLVLINLYILREMMRERYIYVEDKDTGEIHRLKPGPSGYEEV